ncbi:hypothetical protein SPRG_07756 [Saprolegnia parasitica CBS 223.65]|uniref:C2 NT-type domain-containing protein n=1 Tax=Saprolegnia parasitica (strain CBS 223.65) TaxID=695850 RepID=A0A067CCY6_SAPPC|nr:hypothetical protein SPRG_07756 [Saprolegnia parasitica CBS 223.65]KDO27045.1 hypothetical protein SPRG_07756 [Saprolegnia parasitica CBS 223.65]|eukprot:XP_012202140.1 hypothetical protein SPRG_07756 [Saprolegnia parasitica CBS 223.65]
MQSFFLRRPRIVVDVDIQVEGCYNLPESHGRPISCAWTYADGRRGDSPSATIVEQCVKWPSWRISLPRCELPIGQDAVVASRCVCLSVRQETSSSRRHTRLGVVSIDVADFAGRLGASSRRYLLQNSSLNSTLHVLVHTKQVDGDVLLKTNRRIEAAAAVVLPSRLRRRSLDRHVAFGPLRSLKRTELGVDRDANALDARGVHAIVSDILRTSEELRSRHLPSK